VIGRFNGVDRRCLGGLRSISMVLKPELKKHDEGKGDLLAHNAPRKWQGLREMKGSRVQAGPPQAALFACGGWPLGLRSFYAFARAVEGGPGTKDGGATSVPYGLSGVFAGQRQRASPPQGVAIAFDTAGAPTFRHEAGSAATRPYEMSWPRSHLLKRDRIWPPCRRSISGARMDRPCASGTWVCRQGPDDVLGNQLANRAAKRAGWAVRILSVRIRARSVVSSSSE